MCLRPICSRSCSMQRRSLASQSLDGVDSCFIIRALLGLALIVLGFVRLYRTSAIKLKRSERTKIVSSLLSLRLKVPITGNLGTRTHFTG